MTIKTINVGGAEIAYELSGPAGAQTILLSHCFCANHAFWESHLDACAGFRVLRYDTRGYGRSSRPPGPYTLDQLGSDVIGLIDGLKINRVHYAGVSMGGMIGQTVALSYPERLRSLSLINTTPIYSDAQRIAWRERAAMVLEQGMDAVHEGLMRRWFTDDTPTRVDVPSSLTSEQSDDQQQLREAFNDFVGQTFYSQLLGAMRKTVGKPAYFDGGRAEEVFRGQLDQLLSERMSDATADQLTGPMFELFSLRRA